MKLWDDDEDDDDDDNDDDDNDDDDKCEHSTCFSSCQPYSALALDGAVSPRRYP